MKDKKLWIFAGTVLVIFCFNHIFGWSSYISDLDNLAFFKQGVRENLPYAIAVYTLLTIAGCTFLALPGITFAVFAGLLFGPVLGTVCCSAATTVGAALAFGAGRFFLKDSVKPMVSRNRYLNKWLFDSPEENKLFVLAITRLVPVFPYNLQNFAYGITDIKFSTYIIGSLVFMLPGTAMYTVGAAGFADQENRVLYLTIAAVLAVGVMGIGVFLKKKYIQEGQYGK
ncbi:MAG: TVP38/TMEM64 family protein [Lacrimispora sp.]|uniref:TVP38/TMEM64 family protein n=1 Tax=Lacrimispora sp. TaxID=2719234 RepID=UPI0039E58A81